MSRPTDEELAKALLDVVGETDPIALSLFCSLSAERSLEIIDIKNRLKNTLSERESA